MEETPNKRRGRPRNPRWDAIPIGTRLTLAECARILEIGRETLRLNYIGDAAPRRLPENIQVLRDGHTVLVVRTR